MSDATAVTALTWNREHGAGWVAQWSGVDRNLKRPQINGLSVNLSSGKTVSKAKETMKAKF